MTARRAALRGRRRARPAGAASDDESWVRAIVCLGGTTPRLNHGRHEVQYRKRIYFERMRKSCACCAAPVPGGDDDDDDEENAPPPPVVPAGLRAGGLEVLAALAPAPTPG